MSKKQNESFQLKPKHLIRAAFVISIIAIGALIVGVIGTLNPKRHSNNVVTEHASQTQPIDDGVEVWRPNGTVEPKKIIISEDEKSEPEKTASQNPVIAPQDESEYKSEYRRAKARLETEIKNKDKINDRHMPAVQSETVEAKPVQSLPDGQPHTQPAKTEVHETKGELKPAPKPVQPKPAQPKPVQPKPQSKDVMDNLF